MDYNCVFIHFLFFNYRRKKNTIGSIINIKIPYILPMSFWIDCSNLVNFILQSNSVIVITHLTFNFSLDLSHRTIVFFFKQRL